MDLGQLPKAELHLHIEGTLEPDFAFRLAQRNQLDLPWSSVGELSARYHFADLQSFLDLYYECMQVLRTRQDFAELALAYYARAARDGVRHAEIFFDPQIHIANGNTLDDVIGGLAWARDEARTRWGISGGLILCFLRDLGPEAAAVMLDAARPYTAELIGVGLDSSEVGFPPEPFAPVYDQARALGLHTVAHVGEEGPPAYVWGALDALRVERIDHGVRAVEDPVLVARLVAERTPLTVCPLSNHRLGGVTNLADHPLRRMLAQGLQVTVNSDDPAYFGGYVGANYTAVAEALELTGAEIIQLCRQSIEASFAPAERRAELLAELAAAVDRAGLDPEPVV